MWQLDIGGADAVDPRVVTTPSGQRMLFSATLDRGVARLVSGYLDGPALHAIAPVVTAAKADHQVFVLPAGEKLAIATEIARPGRPPLSGPSTAPTGWRTVDQSRYRCRCHPGNLSQNRRQRSLAAFAAGALFN